MLKLNHLFFGLITWTSTVFPGGKVTLLRTFGLRSLSGKNVREVEMSAAGVPEPAREKSWHESKQLRKRVAFLLKDSGLIPHDVCFRVGAEKQEQPTDIHGHKIFFALASPVFHAMFYGELKEKDDVVDIPDITVDAFRCLMAYAYSDSCEGVNSLNAMDVLFASKKYLVSKLGRYCYEFIQNAIGPESVSCFWQQVGQTPDEIVEAQCLAMMKRDTAEVVASDTFLELEQDMVLQLTSWNQLNIQEVDLYNAVKKWVADRCWGSEDVLMDGDCDLNGMVRNIRFELFTPEQLSKGPVKDGAISNEQLRDLFQVKYGDQQSTMFNRSMRLIPPATYCLSLKLFISSNYSNITPMDWRLCGTFKLVIWADVAPKACQLLRRSVESNHFIRLRHGIAGKGLYCLRKVKGSQTHEFCQICPPANEMDQLEKVSELDAGPGMICLQSGRSGSLDLSIVTMSQSGSYGLNPRNLTGTDCSYGVVVGKVLDGPLKSFGKLGHYRDDVRHGFGLGTLEERLAISETFKAYVFFEISLTD